MTVWQEAVRLAKNVYQTTRRFPKEEQFGLTNQLRRASVSISANVAEGFGRLQSKDKAHFYVIALGSLLESKSLLYVAHELKLINKAELADYKTNIEQLHKQLNKLIGIIRKA